MGENIKLFVYGVSSSCPKGILEKEFNRYGRVSDVFITGKGYAFITMESKEEAEDAIDALNGKKVDGQDIKVEMAVIIIKEILIVILGQVKQLLASNYNQHSYYIMTAWKRYLQGP